MLYYFAIGIVAAFISLVIGSYVQHRNSEFDMVLLMGTIFLSAIAWPAVLFLVLVYLGIRLMRRIWKEVER